ncbi:MAG: hypothetical protein JSR20_06645 [Nitrospira sp.]|nr:hypothetical protein [Nitrospira sp.]
MEGSTYFRVRIALGHMLMRPKDTRRWIVDNLLFRKSAIEQAVPWMSWKAIDFLQDYLKPNLRVFEWGGGGSTLFFSKRGCHVTTVESNENWLNVITANNQKESSGSGSLEIRFIAAETQAPQKIKEYIESVREGAPWDIVLLDGLERAYLSRLDCLKEIPGTVRSGGLVIVDDSYRAMYREIPNILKGWKREVFRGLGSARLGVTQTDIYSAP